MICDEVRTFLRDCIDSFECLDALLLLRRERTAWTTDEICTQLKAREPMLEDALASLVRARLVSANTEKMLTLYRYRVEDVAQDAIVGSLERAYREEPLQVMQLMSTNAIERMRTGAIRAFADAFVLRKGKDRG